MSAFIPVDFELDLTALPEAAMCLWTLSPEDYYPLVVFHLYGDEILQLTIFIHKFCHSYISDIQQVCPRYIITVFTSLLGIEGIWFLQSMVYRINSCHSHRFYVTFFQAQRYAFSIYLNLTLNWKSTIVKMVKWVNKPFWWPAIDLLVMLWYDSSAKWLQLNIGYALPFVKAVSCYWQSYFPIKYN